MRKIKELKTNYPIPDILQHDIDQLIEYINSGHDYHLADCEECEIYGSINMCLMADLITDEQARELRNYYYSRGWLHTE